MAAFLMGLVCDGVRLGGVMRQIMPLMRESDQLMRQKLKLISEKSVPLRENDPLMRHSTSAPSPQHRRRNYTTCIQKKTAPPRSYLPFIEAIADYSR